MIDLAPIVLRLDMQRGRRMLHLSADPGVATTQQTDIVALLKENRQLRNQLDNLARAAWLDAHRTA